jgi:hypothetical protein
MNLIKFLEKNQKLHINNINCQIEGDIMQNHEQNKKLKKVKDQVSMGKTIFFLSTEPFSPGQF